MQLPAKFGIGLISFGASALSSALSFLVIASVWAVRADPSGSGSGYAIVGFMIFAPMVGIVVGIINTVGAYIIARLLPASIRPNFDLALPAWQAILLALASLITGFLLVVLSIILFAVTG
jgi:hypothetical protein